MTIEPKIFTYEEGRIFITPESMFIPEVKKLVDELGEELAIPYIGYAHLMTSLNSPYRSYEEEERKENVIYDVSQTMGEFDENHPLCQKLLTRMEELYSTPLTLYFKEIEQELHRFRLYMKNNPITSGKEGDLAERYRILKESGALVASYNKTKQAAEEELKVKARGKAKLGDY